MTIEEFKSQFVPVFSGQMEQLGFTGSGLRYNMETKTFVFVIELEVDKHKELNLFFGIQPKAITKSGDLKTHDFKKIRPQSCEITRQPLRSLKKPLWTVRADNKLNEIEAYKVFAFFHRNMMPVITYYIINPDLLDKIEPLDLGDKNLMLQKLYGMSPVGMTSRTAWMLAIYHEDKDPALSKAFARYGLDCTLNESAIFGIEDLKRLALR